jgi:ADP-ribosylglycohydrolase
MTLSRSDRFVGCLLGGAVGDALGGAVEFDSWSRIRAKFRERGIRSYALAYGRTGAITDDTQMTLFTAEGLIRARNRMEDRGIVDLDVTLHHAYERWYFTQVGHRDRVPWDPAFAGDEPSGWLVAQDFLHARRAPGNTCMGALSGGFRIASQNNPINDSKGCGGIMRAAPAGMTGGDAFDLGCRAAALTHGHPTGWLAAGAFAQMVSVVLDGGSLETAAEEALARCRVHAAGGEIVAALSRAVTLVDEQPDASPATVESLGEGWVADEALAIGVYCALTADTFLDGIAAAVNHSGDSDSTGSIAGNLLGALLGTEAIETALAEGVEGRDVIVQVARDMAGAFVHGAPADWERYPPW